MEHSKRAARRRYAVDFKAQVLSECAVPGASTAAIALAHGLNTNLVHKWRRRAMRTDAAAVCVRQTGSFIPLTIAPSAALAHADIRIELRRGPTSVNVSWPLNAASQCAAWLRELVK